MKIEIESTTIRGKYYKVDTINLSCSCPDYQFRQIRNGGLCKHIKDALEKLNKYPQSLAFIDNNNNSVEFCEAFGEEQLEFLKRKGDVYEQKGKIFKVE